MYEYAERKGPNGKILSDYAYLDYLPGLKSLYVPLASGEAIQQQLNDPAMEIIVIYKGQSPAVHALLESGVQTGAWKLTTDGEYFKLFEKTSSLASAPRK
jgi:hypothetical protein